MHLFFNPQMAWQKNDLSQFLLILVVHLETWLMQLSPGIL